MTDSKLRSMLKAISWRIVASLITGGLVYAMTHRGKIAVSVGVLDSLVKILAYFFHERIWGMIRFGREMHDLEDIDLKRRMSEEDKELIRRKLKELGYLDD